MKKFIPDEKAMLEWGAMLAQHCYQARTIIFLSGQLGAGKTTLVRGFLRGLNYEGAVKSPTYTLVESYELLPLPVFHFDFYRIMDPEELEFIGIHDYFAQQAVFLVEWPEKGLSVLPVPDLTCVIGSKEQGREITMQANSRRGQAILDLMQ